MKVYHGSRNDVPCTACLETPQAGAAEKGVPLYKHIADLAGNSKLVGVCEGAAGGGRIKARGQQTVVEALAMTAFTSSD